MACLRDDDHESRSCLCQCLCARLPRCLPAWRFAMAGDTGMRFAGLGHVPLLLTGAASPGNGRSSPREGWSAVASIVGKAKMRSMDHNSFAKTHGDIALHHRHVSQMRKRAGFAASYWRVKVPECPVATFCSWVAMEKLILSLVADRSRPIVSLDGRSPPGPLAGVTRIPGVPMTISRRTLLVSALLSAVMLRSA